MAGGYTCPHFAAEGAVNLICVLYGTRRIASYSFAFSFLHLSADTLRSPFAPGTRRDACVHRLESPGPGGGILCGPHEPSHPTSLASTPRTCAPPAHNKNRSGRACLSKRKAVTVVDLELAASPASATASRILSRQERP